MRHIPFYSLLFLTLALAPTSASAGAWTQDKGKGQAIINALWYSTDELYNNQGKRQLQSRYTKYELNPYLEYGLTDGITIGANLSLQHAHQEASTGNLAQTNWGLGDSEFFARLRVYQQDGFVASLEPMVKLPSPESSDDTPALGGKHPDAGLGLSLGYGFGYGQLQHFVTFDAAYRVRFGAPKDQIKLTTTLGISLTENLMLMPQAFATLRVNTNENAAFTQSTGDDYELYKAQLSLVYRFSDALSLQGGVFRHVYGHNVGAGNGIMFSVWRRF